MLYSVSQLQAASCVSQGAKASTCPAAAMLRHHPSQPNPFQQHLQRVTSILHQGPGTACCRLSDGSTEPAPLTSAATSARKWLLSAAAHGLSPLPSGPGTPDPLCSAPCHPPHRLLCLLPRPACALSPPPLPLLRLLRRPRTGCRPLSLRRLRLVCCATGSPRPAGTKAASVAVASMSEGFAAEPKTGLRQAATNVAQAIRQAVCLLASLPPCHTLPATSDDCL